MAARLPNLRSQEAAPKALLHNRRRPPPSDPSQLSWEWAEWNVDKQPCRAWEPKLGCPFPGSGWRLIIDALPHSADYADWYRRPLEERGSPEPGELLHSLWTFTFGCFTGRPLRPSTPSFLLTTGLSSQYPLEPPAIGLTGWTT